MRTSLLIVVTAALAGCGPQQLQSSGSTPFGANRLADTLAGRAAGTPVACLPSGRTWQSDSIGGALTFRRGNELYVGTLEGAGCHRYGRLGYALMTQNRGAGMCKGDIAWVVHTATGERVGSCVVGSFVPYSAVSKWQ